MGDRIQNYYEWLGISPSASFSEIKSAYRRLVKQWHPDQFGHDPQQQRQADETIKQINEAYDFFKLHQHELANGLKVDADLRPVSTVHRTRPTQAQDYYERGVAFAKDGQYTDALDALSMAIRLNPNYANAYQHRGFIYSVLGYEHRADSDLRKARAMQRPSPTKPPVQHPSAPATPASTPPIDKESEALWICQQVLIGHQDVVSSVTFSRDRRVLISASWDGEIRLWNLKTGEPFGKLEHGEAVYAITLSPEGDHLASAGRDGTIRLWHWKTGTLVRKLSGHASTVKSLAFTPNRRQLISGSFDQTLNLWDIQQGKILHTFTGHTAPIWAVSINPDGQTLISGGEDRQIRMWNVQTYQQTRTYSCDVERIYAIVCHPNRQDIALGTSDRNLLRFNLQTQAFLPPLVQHADAIQAVAITPNGQWMASGGRDRTVKLWTPDQSCLTLHDPTGEIMALAFSPDSNYLASAGTDKIIRLWKTRSAPS